MREKVDPANLRAAWWTARALRRARRCLRAGTIGEVPLPRPPRVPDRAIRGIEGALRRLDHTCLERSIVLQRWHREHGRDIDLVIGVTAPSGGFTAHAWLDGEPDGSDYGELLRLRPKLEHDDGHVRRAQLRPGRRRTRSTPPNGVDA